MRSAINWEREEKLAVYVLTECDLKYGVQRVLNIDGNLETLYETFSAQETWTTFSDLAKLVVLLRLRSLYNLHARPDPLDMRSFKAFFFTTTQRYLHLSRLSQNTITTRAATTGVVKGLSTRQAYVRYILYIVCILLAAVFTYVSN